jgi:hypothetical protein
VREEELYKPLRTYLEKQGYNVRAEVQECDLVAVKGEEFLIIELKTRITTALLIQAARRKDICDAVYIAVPLLPGKKQLPHYSGLRTLLKRLEVGLILIRFMKTKTRVEVLMHPQPFERRMRKKKKRVILREIDGRYGEFHRGGIPTTKEKITAYKQEAIKISFLLRDEGPQSPKELKEKGARQDKTQRILSANVYGWFDKPSRGVYELNQAGEEALRRYEKEHPGIRKAVLSSCKSMNDSHGIPSA